MSEQGDAGSGCAGCIVILLFLGFIFGAFSICINLADETPPYMKTMPRAKE